jgi:hypothetical protein
MSIDPEIISSRNAFENPNVIQKHKYFLLEHMKVTLRHGQVRAKFSLVVVGLAICSFP